MKGNLSNQVQITWWGPSQFSNWLRDSCNAQDRISSLSIIYRHQGSRPMFNYLCWLAHEHKRTEIISTTQLSCSKLLSVFGWNRLDCSVVTNYSQILAIYNIQGLFFKYTPCPVCVSRGLCPTPFSRWDPQGWTSLSFKYRCSLGWRQRWTMSYDFSFYLNLTGVTSTPMSISMEEQVNPSLTSLSWGNIISPPEGKQIRLNGNKIHLSIETPSIIHFLEWSLFFLTGPF